MGAHPALTRTNAVDGAALVARTMLVAGAPWFEVLKIGRPTQARTVEIVRG